MIYNIYTYTYVYLYINKQAILHIKMSSHKIADVVKFKNDINEWIDKHLEVLKKTRTDEEKIERVMGQVINYFYRMQNIYGSTQESDDDTEGFVSEEDNDDYTKIMQNRVYLNPNNNIYPNFSNTDNTDSDADTGMQASSALDPEDLATENYLKKKLLGLNSFDFLDDKSNLSDEERIDFDCDDINIIDNEDIYTDSSSDPVNYDQFTEIFNSNIYLLNNKRKTIHEFAPDQLFKLDDLSSEINYNEPELILDQT